MMIIDCFGLRQVPLDELTIEDARTFEALGLRLECNDGQVVGVVEEE